MTVFRPFVFASVLLSSVALANAFVAGPARGDGLLYPLQATEIGGIEKFVAAEAFAVGNRIGGRTLSAVGLSFTAHFLGVVETNVPPVALHEWELCYTTGDGSLIKAVGGERNGVVPFLAYVHRVMEMGDAGVGHTDWRSNFAYVRSPVDRRLWAVHWTVNYANEWNIGAVHVPHDALDWRAGSRLFAVGDALHNAGARREEP